MFQTFQPGVRLYGACHGANHLEDAVGPKCYGYRKGDDDDDVDGDEG